jgi:hypothetical protein
MSNEIYVDSIPGARNTRTLASTLILFLAGLGFFLTGFSSYLGINLIIVTDTSQIHFLPQGITMIFYGTGSFCLSLYLSLSMIWNLGGGYNEFSKAEQVVRVVRKGYPGKNRTLFFSYEFALLKSLKFVLKQGLNPRCTLYLVLKDRREIPLYPSQYLLGISEMEKKALFLSDFLNIPIEKKKPNL